MFYTYIVGLLWVSVHDPVIQRGLHCLGLDGTVMVDMTSMLVCAMHGWSYDRQMANTFAL